MLRVGADLSGFNTALSSIPEKLNQTMADAEKAWAPISNLGQNMMGIGAGLSAAITAPLVGIGAEALRVSENLNMAQLAFGTMLGSGEKAKGFLDQLQQFAASTPFEFPELVDAAKRMMAMGFESDQVLPTLRSIGDAAAALGGGAQFIDGVTTALGQMQAKGKVSAEEMNQLAERGVPAWQMLSDKIGVSIPEAMKLAENGAIAASTAIPAILEGMNQKFGGQMETASQTLTGVWSNFKDQVTMTLGDIGKELAPIGKTIVEAAGPVLQFAKDGVTWFSQLPDPVKNAGIALGALAAGVGPLLLGIGGITTAFAAAMPALTGLATFLFGAGATAGALVAPAVAIAAVVAALVALGTWVYDNWEPIKATVSQAWDGLTEMWSAQWNAISGVVTGAWQAIYDFAEPVFGPLRSFFSTIWDGLEWAFSAVWNAIKGSLTTVWDAIKTSASTVWNGITGTFQSFLGWAEKIPGVNKLFNLDEAWNAANKLKEGVEATTKAGEQGKPKVDEYAAALKGLGVMTDKEVEPKVRELREKIKLLENGFKDGKITAGELEKAKKKLKDEIEKLTGKSDRAKTSFDNLRSASSRLKDKHTELTATAKLLNDQHEKHIKHSAELKLKLDSLKDSVIAIDPPTDAFNASLQAIIASSVDLSKVTIPGVIGQIDGMKGSTMGLNEALGALGVKSKTEYDKVAADAKRAYDAVVGSGMATPTEQNNAMLAMLRAQKDAMVANGTKIPADMQAMIDKLETTASSASTGMPKVTGTFTTFGDTVSGMFASLNTKLGDLLFDGDMSWAEKGKAALGTLKDAFTNSFVTPVTDSINDLITGALSDLIGGKGFGGVLQSIKDIGSSVTGVFGGGSSAASSASSAGGGIPGTSGGAGGVAAGAGTAAVVGAVGSVVGAISSVVGNFQMAKQETTLNAIEGNTRYAQLYLGGRSDQGILGQMFRIGHALEFGTIVQVGEQVRDTLWAIRDVLVDKEGTSVFSALTGALDTGFQGMADLLDDGVGYAREINERFQNALAGLGELRQYSSASAVSDREQSALLREIAISTKQRPAVNVTINVSGAGDPDAVANRIASRLRTQLVY